MKKNLLLVCALMLMIGTLKAQNFTRCATSEYLAAQKIADPGLAARMAEIENQTQKWISDHPDQRTTAVITIPVVVHVLYANSTQNISDAKINEQIHVLNMDFSRTNADAGNTPSVWQGISVNTQVQFCFAQRDPNGNATNGIVRKSTTVSSFSSNDNVKHNSTGGDDAWPAGSYLNIWVCNLGGGLLGYATFPGGSASVDGVVVLYSSVGGPAAPGTANPYHLGRTATHEIGHWLNLRHINGDGNCASDLVSDTPTQDQLHFGCPNHPYHVNVCSGSSNGEMFMNYMDYTDDACMNMFTAGQASRMTATLTGTRASIQTSLGCTPVTGGCGIPSGLNATSITQTSATLNWNAASGANSYNVQYRQTGTTTWTTTTSSSTSKAISGLTGGTQYDFHVQTVCTGSSSSYSSIANFTTLLANCSNTYEPNNTKATAVAISLNTTIASQITPSGDLDFYSFNNSVSAPNIHITLTNLPADYDIRLIKGTVVASSTNGGLTNETINYNTSVVGSYRIKVSGSGGANSSSQCYNLFVSTSSGAFTVSGNNIDIANESRMTDVLALYPNPVNDVLNLEFNSSTDGSISVNIVDMIGKNVLNVQKAGTKGINNFEVSVKDLTKGIYFVQVNNGAEREIKKIVVSK